MLTIGQVLEDRISQLASSSEIVFILIIVASVIMCDVEKTVQPGKFSNAISGLWWAVATFTTVGYVDIYPIIFCWQTFERSNSNSRYWAGCSTHWYFKRRIYGANGEKQNEDSTYTDQHIPLTWKVKLNFSYVPQRNISSGEEISITRKFH